MKPWQTIYYVEEIGDGEWGIINNTSITGHRVLSLGSQQAADFYAELMNEVYNQAVRDIRG